MKIIKNLNMNIVKKGIGFNRREDLDYTNNGSKIKGYDYKGIPITTLREDGVTYLHINAMGAENVEFTKYDWDETEESKLEFEFNGLADFYLEKLIDSCEKILAKIHELNEECEAETLDIATVIKRLEFEKLYCEAFICKARYSVRWWEIDMYNLRRIKFAYNSLEEYVEILSDMINSTDKFFLEENKKMVRCYIKRFEKCGYVILNCSDSNQTLQKLKEVM